MGLCKCPKRKTTSHFCFHHCVNVCEHCIVNNHTTCVVKSYTTWLKEASGSVSSSTATASALCAVCQKQFVLLPKNVHNPTNSFNDRKTAIRLLCYHVVHAHCLSVYVKKQLKEGNTTKCPSCVRPLWLPDQLQESNDSAGPESNELSPVASQLHKHLLNHGDWWGQALITNGNVKDLEKYLLEDNDDDNDEHIDEQNQQLTDQSSFKIIKQPTNTVSNNTSPLAHTIQSTNSENSYYNNYDSSEILHTPSDVTTINHRSSTHQTYQPIHHRHFNNNYGIDSVYTPSQQQQLQQQSVNMTAVAQGSDLSNRHAITSSTTLLLNNDKNVINDEEQQDPSGKYRPKKFNNQSWSLSYKRLTQYISGNNNKTEDNGSTRIAIIIIVCVLIIVVLLVAITSYTRSSNEPFDSNSIDYGGEDDPNKNGGEANLKSYDTNL